AGPLHVLPGWSRPAVSYHRRFRPSRHDRGVMMNVSTNTHNPRRIRTHADLSPNDRARRLADEAWAWARFALERAALPPEKLYRKALDALAFSLDAGAHHFAVPSKLVGVREHQEALVALHELGVPFGTRLFV